MPAMDYSDYQELRVRRLEPGILEVVMRASDTVVVMNEGRVIASGPPAAVRNDARVVDAYLGAAP